MFFKGINNFIMRALSLLILFLLFSSFAYADQSWDYDFLNQTKVSGNIRLYNFSRNPSAPNTITQNALALGGSLNILTGPIVPGLQAGATFYTTQPLGNSSLSSKTDNTLPGYSIETLGQAFLQYKYQWLFIKAGRQTLETPWMNSNDGRMIPATYNGIYTTITPNKDLSFIGLRMFRFKGRVADDFSATNLYNVLNIGGSGITAFNNTPNKGTLAFGVKNKIIVLENQAWIYKFYDFANLAYGESKYKFTTTSVIKPYLSGQILREWGDGNNVIAPYTGGKANASALGFLTGVDINNLGFSFAYNAVPTNTHSFKNGDILSPYTTGYTIDPLYTTSMIAGLVEKTSGQAFKLASTLDLFDKRLHVLLSYAKYYTAPRTPNTNETNLDMTYRLSGAWKGFSIRNRLGVLYGNPVFNRFIYNRVMLQYSF